MKRIKSFSSNRKVEKLRFTKIISKFSEKYAKIKDIPEIKKEFYCHSMINKEISLNLLHETRSIVRFVNSFYGLDVACMASVEPRRRQS